ncbi:MAG: histidinol-phosphate transaminase [Actinobacteria bacterium]|nr:histidinol-phosphate transaminase [Actinomycetota bacterium]
MSAPTWPAWLPLRDSLRGLTPYGAPQISSVTRMNTNENPYPPSTSLAREISAKVLSIAQELNRYPDRDATKLRAGLADYLNQSSSARLTSEQIWAANGSNEIIQTLFLAFGERGALGFVPSYSMHALIAKVTSTRWVDGRRDSDFSLNQQVSLSDIARERPSLTFITTPNNPTGSTVSLETIEILANATAEVGGLLLVDEAYAEFSAQPSAITLLAKYPNIVVIRTMSKAFAFAGARIGYLAANQQIVQAVQLVRLPYHLSQVTQALGLVALEHKDELLQNVNKLVAARNQMSQDLLNLGCKVIPSEANFILFAVGNSGDVWTSLLDKGILIRDVGLPGYLRVTVGTEEENKRFIQALSISLPPKGGNP